MEDKVEVKKIVLNISGKEVSLTVEQAKKLKGMLEEIFGKVVEEHHHHYDRWYYPTYPIVQPQPLSPYYWSATSQSINCSL